MFLKLVVLVVGVLLLDAATSNSVIIERMDAKEFKVIWNIPTHMCRRQGIPFDDLAQKWNIIQNTNETFHGDRMVIMYDPGNFPAILINSQNGEQVLRNGGVPQEGNLTDHLLHFESHIANDIPNVHFNGVAVIDFESWRPVFRQNFGSLLPYKKLSIEIERKRHPTWSNAELEKEARRRFEHAGKIYVQYTLLLAKTLRPYATWGYYAYPYCFNMNNVNNHDCPPEVIVENDNMRWMFDITDTLHPSIYIPELRLNASQRLILVEGRIKESLRINANLGDGKQIYPYFWYNYQDTNNFLSAMDVRNIFIMLKSFDIDGAILWGSSNDVNTKEKCIKLHTYVDEVLGPFINST